MDFFSLLYDTDRERDERQPEPAFFRDLNLDQVVGAIIKGKEEYNIRPLFFTSLRDENEIYFRQQVMQDLEQERAFAMIRTFSEQMKGVRRHLTQVRNMVYEPQRKAWFLDAATIYCSAVEHLFVELASLDVRSQGLSAFRQYLARYVESAAFGDLSRDTRQTKETLDAIRYRLHIKGRTIVVLPEGTVRDYSAEIEAVFGKFRQGDVKDYTVAFSEWVEMSHIDAQINDGVRRLFPTAFHQLDSFCATYTDFVDQDIVRFDREVQFYVSYLEYISPLRDRGLGFCYPTVSSSDKTVYVNDGFDVALAHKLMSQNQEVVQNDFQLRDEERIIVISGPNQGGKTTFARMFAQIHFLASLGFLVPGQKAKLLLFDSIFTHFEREEHIYEHNGKLRDDLIRIHEVLEHTTSQSILILNEIFSSTSLEDAFFLSEKIINAIIQRDALCVMVTFIPKLTDVIPKTVAMVSTVSEDDPTIRTYKIIPRTADGMTYAMFIAEQFRLTYLSMKERLQHEGKPHESGPGL